MAADDRIRNSDAVDLVMNEVLAAEGEARQAVEKCRAQAAQIVAEAEERARRIRRRTECRIKQIHRIADLSVDRTLRELHRSKPERGPQSARTDAPDALAGAVDALIEEILGGPS